MRISTILLAAAALLFLAGPAAAQKSDELDSSIYQVPELEPIDSELKVAVGDEMPDFELETIEGGMVRLSDFTGDKHLVLSFVPAAWTPVCTGQWPGYNILEDTFEGLGATLVGISVDNTPSQFAWVTQMGGLWFTVASDFWPHGELSSRLGILRTDGTSERALFVVDREGIIRYIDVHDINSRPDLGNLLDALEDLQE
jgi:peroxiredoxin